MYAIESILWRDFNITLKKQTQRLAQQLFGAIAFYTTIPISTRLTPNFTRIARFAPLVGLLLGAILVMFAHILNLGLPPLLSGVLIIALWLKLTGALHLDGVMDAADGLGVFDPEQRLIVMADSRSGAFGVIAGIILLMLKVTAVSEIVTIKPILLWLVPVWGRFAHVLAVGLYPYLKLEGKGAMHRADFVWPWDYLPGLVTLLSLSVCLGLIKNSEFVFMGGISAAALATSWGVGQWFYQKFDGMTGDLYGAIVEWSETLILVEIVCLFQGIKSF